MLVVIVTALMIGVSLFALTASLVENEAPLALEGLTYVIATAVGLGSAALSLVTGVSPTAIVYLRHKEVRLRALGKTAAASRIRCANWLIGVIAATTVLLTVAIAVVVGVTAAPAWLASQ